MTETNKMLEECANYLLNNYVFAVSGSAAIAILLVYYQTICR